MVKDRLGVLSASWVSFEDVALVHTSSAAQLQSHQLLDDVVRQTWLERVAIKVGVLLLAGLLILFLRNVLELLNSLLQALAEVAADGCAGLDHIFYVHVGDTVEL